MQFVWAGDRTERYSRRTFTINLAKKCDKIIICAVDFYRVYLDGKFTCYGPERTAAGYSRKREILLNDTKKIDIEVAGYNHLCYACDLQQPFFGAEIFCGEKVEYQTIDFTCYEKTDRLLDVPRFSGQRTAVEYYDLTCVKIKEHDIYQVDPPILLEGIGDTANYEEVKMQLQSQKEFSGFSFVAPAVCEKNPKNLASENGFMVQRDFLDKTKNGYQAVDFFLERELTGFVKLKITASTPTEIFVVMEEYLLDGKWTFRRSGCNEIMVVKVPVGEFTIQSFEPYAFKYLKVIYKGQAEITPSLIKLENTQTNFISLQGENALVDIFNASKNSFSQNAVDVFTDCPGRERAGWLCDSYFEGVAERLFTGENKIERAYLENLIICDTPELPKGMLPKSFPSESLENHYIPNWAMWFVIELKDYFLRTKDRSLVDKAKQKVYNLVEFFAKYENEYGLLEDLESWVFVEWSECNNKEYIKGVNFPSNMLYYAMLLAISELYQDKGLEKKAKDIKENIIKLSFNGEFFIENAVRENGKLVCLGEHLTETCQYYALFFNVYNQEDFSSRIIKDFGPLRKEGVYPNVAKSNMFIGNYLRFFYLASVCEYNRILQEMTDYFKKMVEKTGTLWEHDSPKASCNHGFTAVSAHLILKCISGYDGVKDGKPIFLDLKKAEKYGVKIIFE